MHTQTSKQTTNLTKQNMCIMQTYHIMFPVYNICFLYYSNLLPERLKVITLKKKKQFVFLGKKRQSKNLTQSWLRLVFVLSRTMCINKIRKNRSQFRSM